MDIRWDKNRQFAENIFETIGSTPLVRLNKVTKDVKPQILGKLDLFNPSSSLKDRIYYRMIKEAEKKDLLKKGMKIIESSTGNAGIACTFVGRLLGYDVTIVLPAGMSEERYKILEAYGAEVITTLGGESDVDLSLQKTKEIQEANPGVYWEPKQYDNPYNVRAHYETTGPEIWEQTNGEVDVFVASQGSGGTLTGVGRYLREMKPKVKLFAVEPAEAPMLSKRLWGSHKIEGIGDGFVPRNLDLSILNGVVTTTSEESIRMAQQLALEEGIFCGISSGCNVAAALKVVRRIPEVGMIVTMINDTGQRYLSTELCGVQKKLEIPEREHPMDKYTRTQLDKYQEGWIIID
ncbi:MAG: cysteine synthase [Nitrososphaeria archaeon]|nr:cysteine synthase [Nitrososphaeria archaeon]NIN53396.1 cysteine synthase [Nitrososphaeria archaeon]NIQ33908.1 cysteine synthase [Nitrososphaeria archaeon]